MLVVAGILTLKKLEHENVFVEINEEERGFKK